MRYNPFGFLILLPVTIWVIYSVVQAYKTGEIFSRGMYSYKRDQTPFMYWQVFLIHVGIVIGLIYALISFM